MTERTFTTTELAQFWRADPTTTRKLRLDGEFTPPDGQGIYPFTEALVDAYHTNHAVVQGVLFPPLSELLAYEATTQKPSLLFAREYAKEHWLTESVVYKRIHSGHLPAFKIGIDYRVPAMAVIAKEGTVPLRQAVALTGISPEGIKLYAKSGNPDIQLEMEPGGRSSAALKETSVMAYIEAHLAHGTAEEWRALRILHHYDALLSPIEIEARYCIAPQLVQAAVNRGEIPCIYTPEREMLIPLHAMEHWRFANTPVSTATVMSLTGVAESIAAAFIATRALCGTHLPSDPATCPTLACLAGYINANRTTKEELGENWITQCLEQGLQPITGERLRQTFADTEVTDHDLLGAIATKTLRGFLLPRASSKPLDVLVMLNQDARAFVRKIRLANRGS